MTSVCKTIAFLLSVISVTCAQDPTFPPGPTFNLACGSHITLPDQTNTKPPTYTYLECSIVQSGFTEEGLLTIEWLSPSGQQVPMDDSKYERYNSTYGNETLIALDVWRLAYTDRGVYSVVVQRNDPFATLTNRAFIQLDLLTSLNASVMLSDSSAELSCEMSGYIHPDNELQWLKDGQPLIQDNRMSITFEQGSSLTAQNGGFNNTHSRVSVLRVAQLSRSDEGHYTCSVPNQVSARLTLTMDGPVRDPPTTTTPAINPLIALTAVPVVLILFLCTVLIAVVAVMIRRRRKSTKPTVSIKTSPNVSYGSHVTETELLDDPLYESIRSGVHYDIAQPPDEYVDYYVNEGLGPDD